MLKRLGVLLIGVALLAGCASMPSGTRGQSDLITAEELEALSVSNLYQAVNRLRPRWLDVRAPRSLQTPTEIVVYRGQSYLGGLDMLRQLGLGGVYALRYLDGSTASATLPGLGSRQVEGAIIINPER